MSILQEVLGKLITGFYLKDIDRDARACIIKLMEEVFSFALFQARLHLNRDYLWSKMISRPMEVPLNEEWLEFSISFWYINIESRGKFKSKAIDVSLSNPKLIPLFQSKNLPWQDIVSFLLITYDCRQVYLSELQLLPELVIFNSKDDDYCYYLKPITDEYRDGVQIFSLSREGFYNPIECEHLNHIVNSILFILWQNN